MNPVVFSVYCRQMLEYSILQAAYRSSSFGLRESSTIIYFSGFKVHMVGEVIYLEVLQGVIHSVKQDTQERLL